MNWISWHCNKLTAAEEKTCFLLLSNVVCASLCFAELLQKWQLLNVAGSESASITSTASVAVSYGGNSVCLFAIRKIQLKLYFDFHWKTSFSGWRKVGAVSNTVVSMRIWDSTFNFFVSFEFVLLGVMFFTSITSFAQATTFQIVLWNSKLPFYTCSYSIFFCMTEWPSFISICISISNGW